MHKLQKILISSFSLTILFLTIIYFLMSPNNNQISQKLQQPRNLKNSGNLEELRKYIKDFKKVTIPNQLHPSIEEINQNGTSTPIPPSKHINPDQEYSYYFTMDDPLREFKVLQMTDVHIGGGDLSDKYDKLSLRAVAAMIAVEKPDLVIFTGDSSFTWENRTGNNDNKIPPTIIVEMMQKLGVYWATVYGNHDTEEQMPYTREQISDYFVNNSFIKNQTNYCLFISGPKNIYGYGNYMINLKNKNNKIVKTFFFVDSNSYVKIGDKSYDDRIHDDQINWYAQKVKILTDYNRKIEQNCTVVSSEMFFHIPINTVKDAVDELMESKGKKTKNFERLYGNINENVCAPNYPMTPDEKNRLINTVVDLGSTEVLYFGHDHVNNAKFYHRGIILSYGMSIDFYAYDGLDKCGKYRGCTMMKYKFNNSETVVNRIISSQSYYLDKYKEVEEIPWERDVLTPEELKSKYNKDFPDYITDPD